MSRERRRTASATLKDTEGNALTRRKRPYDLKVPPLFTLPPPFVHIVCVGVGGCVWVAHAVVAHTVSLAATPSLPSQSTRTSPPSPLAPTRLPPRPPPRSP